MSQLQVAIVAYSFGFRGEMREPGPVNEQLARQVVAAVQLYRGRGYDVRIIAQWEIAKALEFKGVQVGLVVELPADESYLSSTDVWSKAQEYCVQNNIRNVISIANPFLHLPSVRRFVKSDEGLRSVKFRVGKVGFDNSPDNLQWWTKGPMRLGVYSLLTIAGYHGHGGRQLPTTPHA